MKITFKLVRIRQAIFWFHLAAGSLAGVVIFVMSVTGVLLAFEKQITAWADGGHSEAQAGSSRIAVGALLVAAKEARGGHLPTSLTLSAEPGDPAVASFGRDEALLLDPASARVLGSGSAAVRGFFHATTELHRWLAAGTAWRDVGRAVTGASNLAFLGLVLTGALLWLPPAWTRRHLAAVTMLQLRARGRARDFNWHNVLGIWCVLPLVAIVASGVVISYPWAGDLVYRAAGSEAPRRSPPRPRAATPVDVPNVDALWARAEQQVPDWRLLTMRLPTTADLPVTFAIDASPSGVRPDRRSQLVLDRQGNVVSWEPFASLDRGRRWRTWVRFLHTGEVAGLPGQTLAAAASLGAAVLVWTGLSLSWRRFQAWRRRTPSMTNQQEMNA